jgi:hypothetical protein
VQDETAKTWIKPKEKKQGGWLDVQALQAHHGGKGSKAVCVKEGVALWRMLHCTSKRTMLFEKFLASMQAVFTGFSKKKEMLNDAQQIRILFAKVQNPSLQQVKNALQVLHDFDRGGTHVTFDFVANNLAAEAAGPPCHVLNCKARGLESCSGGQAPEGGVKGQDGVMFAGSHPSWQQLSEDNKPSVCDKTQAPECLTQEEDN